MPSRRAIVTGLAALPLAGLMRPALAQSTTDDVLATSEGDVLVHPVGHASLLLQFGPHVLYVDPAKMDFSGLPAPTGILITHAHPDHFDAAALAALAGDAPLVVNQEVADNLPTALQARATIMKNGDDGTLDGLPVSAVAAYNTTPERQQYHPQGRDNGYVVSFSDKKIYIAGDTEPTPEMAALTDIDIAFLPMNLPYTMTVEQAAEAVRSFHPRVVYPYHYRGSDTEAFSRLVGDAAEVRLRDWYADA